MKKIGLTGGMASGKSKAAVFLRDHFHLHLIDADLVCRDLLKRESEGWRGLVQILGDTILTPDGELDRPALRTMIFDNEKIRNKVNTIIHPLAKKKVLDEIKNAESLPVKGVVVEVPLLFEAGWQDMFDSIIVISADKDICMSRLMRRDNMSSCEAEKALTAQWPLAEKVKRADYVVDNSGPWHETAAQLAALGDLLWS